MTETSQYVEKRLQVWADWCARGCSFGLVYPSKTWEAKLMETGGIWVKGTGTYYPPSHPEAEEIEALVSVLAQDYVTIANALREYHLGEGTMTQKAKRVGLSYAQFKICVDKARMWLDGRLRRIA